MFLWMFENNVLGWEMLFWNIETEALAEAFMKIQTNFNCKEIILQHSP